MKVIDAESGWDFWDLLEKTARDMVDQYDTDHYTFPEEVIQDRLIAFLKRLPNGDYSELMKEYSNKPRKRKSKE